MGLIFSLFIGVLVFGKKITSKSLIVGKNNVNIRFIGMKKHRIFVLIVHITNGRDLFLGLKMAVGTDQGEGQFIQYTNHR